MANKRKLSPEQEQQVVMMYTVENMSVASIARAVGVDPITAQRVLRRAGVPMAHRGGGKYRKAPASMVAAAVARYVEGEGCEALAPEFGVTPTTIMQWVKAAGVAPRPMGFQVGAAHHGWRGGEAQTAQGYLLERIYPDDPFFCMAIRKVEGASYVLRHRLVMARHLGRPLTERETVHHIDGNRQNNDISNLQLRVGRHGAGVALCCADCGSHNIVERELQ